MRERIAILKSEITADHKKIGRLFSKFDTSYNAFLRSDEYSRLVESAFHVSQLYSGMENVFKNIAKTFENNILQDYWHKSLLERMCLDIQDIRPALISEESFKYMNELRAFRHFFRQAYDIDLDKEKFKIVANGVIALKDSFERDIKHFLGFLDMLLK